MAMFSYFGESIELPAKAVLPGASTRDPDAWMHGVFTTVRFELPMKALRVHTNGRTFPGRDASQEAGAWILIGDIIETSSELASSRSLPAANPKSMVAFTHVSEAQVQMGTVMNVGLASAKFGGKGGRFQAEYVSGPSIHFTPLRANRWHGAAGRA
jgi:hypothetical protein